jgi:hypothetical protein
MGPFNDGDDPPSTRAMTGAVAALALSLAGCMRVGTDGPVGPGGGVGGTASDGGADAAATSCANPSVLGAPGTYRAVATAPDAGVDAGCGGEIAGATFEMDLDDDSWIYLDTLDSNVDTALSLRAETCDGDVVACSDTACARPAGQLLLPLGRGRYFAVVHAASSEGAVVVLRYQRSGCAATLLPRGSTPGAVGDCAGGEAGSCGGGPTTYCASGVAESVWVLAGCGDAIHLDTCVGTFFDSVLYLRAGDCAGPEAVCADANSCGDGDDETLDGTLAPGMYFLFVDSANFWDSAYNLDFE